MQFSPFSLVTELVYMYCDAWLRAELWDHTELRQNPALSFFRYKTADCLTSLSLNFLLKLRKKSIQISQTKLTHEVLMKTENYILRI